MYTTMDCDFVEHEYFYHHLRSQGESVDDDLSWLTYSRVGTNPTEQENITDVTAETTENIIQFDQIGTTTNDPMSLSENPLSDQVCTPTPDFFHDIEPTDLSLENAPIEQPETLDTPEQPEEGNVESGFEHEDRPRRYVFPSRSTRGIPPKRYDPEFEAQKSKYPMKDSGKEIGMIDCKPVDIPMMMNHGLQIIEGAESVNQTQYQRLVGKLIYLSHTRPDLAYAAGVVSRFMHKLQKQNLEAVYRITKKLMSELGYKPKKSCKLYCDNKAAIQISENPVQHDRTKHVEIDRHFIKDHLEAGVISLPFVRSKDQLADILTKAVTSQVFEEALSKLEVGDPTTQLEGEC
uniref:Copia protein n=1 Tax=Chenopodium quinoa TaxID=63459 RepID=A0A803MV56_CHEQI